MPMNISCTFVTLIPKIVNVIAVNDYRHIACCTVLYKINSKVLTNRLQAVVNDIVRDYQSAFIKGRVIFDNIVMSLELIKDYGKKNVSPRCMLKIDLQKAYESLENGHLINICCLSWGFLLSL